MDHIRSYYGVPAVRGGRILFAEGRPARLGTIVGSAGQYLRVRFDGDRQRRRDVKTIHAGEVEYLSPEDEADLIAGRRKPLDDAELREASELRMFGPGGYDGWLERLNRPVVAPEAKAA